LYAVGGTKVPPNPLLFNGKMGRWEDEKMRRWEDEKMGR
jgi:hypothetical protein